MTTPPEPEPYAALGLPPGAPAGRVKAQFRRLAKRLHPDVNAGDTRHQEAFRRISAAYEFLDDPDRKAEYDARLSEAAVLKALSMPSHPPSDSPWVRVGENDPAPETRSEAEDTRPRKKPRRGRPKFRRRGRLRAGGVLTGMLAACAVYLVGVLVTAPERVPSEGAAAPAAAARPVSAPLSAADDPPPLAVTPGAFPTAADSATILHGSRLDTGPTDGASSPPLGPADAVDPRYTTSGAQYAVDSKYTDINPDYTRIDPQYTTVDVHATSVDPQYTAIDPKYTGIDPQLLRP